MFINKKYTKGEQNMKTVANQKVIRIHKRKQHKERFAIIDKEAAMYAMANLKDSTFKLWFYLSSQADNSTKPQEELWALSRKHVLTYTNLSESSYKRAVKELEEKKYLIKVNGNIYNFYEYVETDQIDTNKKEPVQIELDSGVNLDHGVVSKRTHDMGQIEPRNNTINNTNNNTINKTNDCKQVSVPINSIESESDSISDNDFISLFNKVSISYSHNTKKELEQIINEELDYGVMQELININQKIFYKANDKSSN